MRPAALIYNPAAGRRAAPRILDPLLAELRRGGFEPRPIPTTGPGDATRRSREAAAAGEVEAVFALGGDGTFREVAAGLLGTAVPLGTLPAGTTNVIPRALGIPRRPLAAARALAASAPREIDVGLLGEEPFLMQASGGLDARVMAALDPARKGRLGKLAVLLQGLAEWWRYGYPDLEVRADGRRHRATLAIVANAPRYAGPFLLVPGGRLDDRRLDLVLHRGRGRRAALAFAASLALGRHRRRRDVEIFPVQEVRFEGPPGAPLQIDGDPYRGPLPAIARLAPQRLRVLAPEAAAGDPETRGKFWSRP